VKNWLAKTLLRNPNFRLEEGTSQPSSPDEGEASHEPPSKALVPAAQSGKELTSTLEKPKEDTGA
jgi:hypothetical protein